MNTVIEPGRVLALALRAPHSAASTAVPQLQALAGAGIGGDRHADPYSPRQVLLASAAAYAEWGLPPHALGENLLLDLDTAQLASGGVLQVGDTVLLRLMFQCEACGVLDGYRAGVAARIGGRRGVLARVLAGGAIRPGDRVLDRGVVLPAWDDDWRARVARVLLALPDGMVVTYARLARLAGVQASYCRAFPRLLDKLGQAGRAVTAQAAAGRRCWDGAGLFGEEAAGAVRCQRAPAA